MEILVRKCSDIVDMTNKISRDMRQKERKHLIDVIRCLRYPARQGIDLQGSPENDNYSQLLILLGCKDPDILTTLNQSRF